MKAEVNNMEPQDFVNKILKDAVDRNASDVYWIPGHGTVDIRFRIDGQQSNIASVPRDYGTMCLTRIKVIAGLLTYRTHIAQDGVIRNLDGAPNAELRVAVMPTNHGERISVRIIRGSKGSISLDELGFGQKITAAMRDMLRQPSGMIVLTGPTGSGKTTTIYAIVRELLSHHQDPASIITIEDPIESEIPGISQVSVTQTHEWGYADALRSALRQDVKTIVVGEMRDKDVVNVTLDAALTGHRVITTYHAGDIPSVYARMLHQGFEPFLIASAITGVITQRLASTPGKTGRIPVVALLTPDDKWRNIISINPGLEDLRKAIKDYPEADLDYVVDKMKADGQITPDTKI